MGGERKVDNLLGLAVLSTVYQRPMHRYEMASIIRARGKDQQMDFKWGSLYTVVQNLAKHGFLEAVGITRKGSRPERTIYRITDAGTSEMLAWTRDLLSRVFVEHPRFEAGLSVCMALAPAEVTALLTERLAHLEASATAQRAAMAQLRTELPRIFLIENEFSLAMVTAEVAWVRSLVGELAEGTFPDLAQWQRMHDDGDLPSELSEPGERGATPD